MRDGVPLGFVNPTLYARGLAGDSDSIRDVTDTPSNAKQPIAEVFPPFQGQDGGGGRARFGRDLRAASGYDEATGLGTPGPWFVDSLAAR